MTTTAKALKDHISDGGSLLTLLSGMEAVSRMVAAASYDGKIDNVSTGDIAFLLADLLNVVSRIVEDSQ
ncbi:hypothetical protein [Glaciimonas immobilis]|uniref:Uncharacterized protein n=1 Tax=Glaciimonas immobilis TaxID=728004 RepID=A0A840RLV1_9BURK|nr:hypothetical protein [Glaciimonas immobilis]KAF3999174.1 hypothetical protein HAV38_04345 [Glaciimonas immobilis]MBB5198625.1 hypothetical protein [Glaciimonas immobilis]